MEPKKGSKLAEGARGLLPQVLPEQNHRSVPVAQRQPASQEEVVPATPESLPSVTVSGLEVRGFSIAQGCAPLRRLGTSMRRPCKARIGRRRAASASARQTARSQDGCRHTESTTLTAQQINKGGGGVARRAASSIPPPRKKERRAPPKLFRVL